MSFHRAPSQPSGTSTSEFDPKLNFRLPDLVESQRQGWVSSAQAAAVVSVLFCGAEAVLMASVKAMESDTFNPHTSTYRLLLLLSYSAFVLNASATIASLIMIDILGDMPRYARELCDQGRLPTTVNYSRLLEDHGAGHSWGWMRTHCLVSLAGGSWCLMIQIFLYIQMQEAKSVWIPMAFVCVFGISPWFSFLRRPRKKFDQSIVPAS